MSKKVKIPASDEAWDSGELGRDPKHAKRLSITPERRDALDASLDLQLISIRLPKGLIDDLKRIGVMNGLGYQPLVRQVLSRFVHAELKRIARDRMEELRDSPDRSEPPEPVKRAA